jgi:hypothetical protein
MKDGFRVVDSDLHVIESGEVYENYMNEKYRDTRPRYLGWSPTNFLHWDVQGQLIPPWARSADVVGPQKYLDAPSARALLLIAPGLQELSTAPQLLGAPHR